MVIIFLLSHLVLLEEGFKGQLLEEGFKGNLGSLYFIVRAIIEMNKDTMDVK